MPVKIKKKIEEQYLTPAEFLKLPLSEAILYVIDDIARFTKLGYTIDMSIWGDINKREGTCSVCLGGAACLGFLPDAKLKLLDLVEDKDDVIISVQEEVPLTEYLDLNKIANVFNDLRNNHLSEAAERWYGVWSTEYKRFRELEYSLVPNITRRNRTLNKEDLELLISELKDLAKFLKTNQL